LARSDAFALTEYADRPGKPKSLVGEAAIASFLSPDAAERQEAALARRLDRITRQLERLERDVGISAETIALFIRIWLMATPSLPEQTQAPSQPKAPSAMKDSCERLAAGLLRGLASSGNHRRYHKRHHP
jgi:hypothetical protein